MNKINNRIIREGLILLFFIVLYIGVRSIFFSSHLNFSSEQASFALKSRELLDNRKIELIGPPISYRFEGRYFFQGSITYYVMIPLLLLGHWDPTISSYMMVLLGAVMVLPLYFGTKLLLNKKSAYCLVLLFSLLPLFINYSRFFWNPNLQFILSPIVILWMGLFHKYRRTIFLFLVSITAGALMLFHYQFFLIIVGLIFYYFYTYKLTLQQKVLFIAGFFIGFSPLILFELRNKFYNLNTLCLFFRNFNSVFMMNGGHGFALHYILSILLFTFLFFSYYLSKISSVILFILFTLLGVFVIYYYSFVPSHGFGMPEDWNYGMELKTYQIIKENYLSHSNIVNLGYDTIAIVQKYLLITHGVHENFDDYYRNRYLYVITKSQDYMSNPAYEINTFKPNRVLKSWQLNATYSMYLLERVF